MVILEHTGGFYAFSCNNHLITPWFETKDAAIEALIVWRRQTGGV